MYFWKLIIGAVAGAVLVKESEKAGTLYDLIRGKLIAVLKKVQEKPQVQDTGSDVTPENTGPA